MDPQPSYRSPYLDACIWIAAITGPPAATEAEAELARQILSSVDANGMKVVASTILQAEVVKWPPGPTEKPVDPDRLIDQYLSRSFIEWIELDMVTAQVARRLRRDHKLKTADAVHLATAMRARADVLLTTDKDLLAVGNTEGVPVHVPYWHGALMLPMPDAPTIRPETA